MPRVPKGVGVKIKYDYFIKKIIEVPFFSSPSVIINEKMVIFTLEIFPE